MLTLDYRPVRFRDLSGQESARMVLQSLVKAGDIPPALLFTGHSGTGKTSAARVLAAALNCDQATEGDCCGECSSCMSIQAGTSLAVHEVDAATSGGVNEVRALKDLSTYTVVGATWRVILLDEAHSLSRAAFEALLKVLEEPPAHTVFVLLTTEPEKILGTVRSRSMPIYFRPLSSGVIRKRLTHITEHAGITMPEIVLTEMAEVANGGMRDAVMLLDQAHKCGVQSLESLRSLTGKTDIPQRLIGSLIGQDHSTAMSLLDEFYEVSADTSDLIGGMLADLQVRFSGHTISPQRMIAATKLLWDGRSLAPSALRSPKVQMEALITLLWAVFREEGKVPAPKPILRVEESLKSATNGAHRLGAEELAAIEF